MLQSEAGYIDARPHIRQLDEVLLQRTAGPYIGSDSVIRRCRFNVRFARRRTWLKGAQRLILRRSLTPWRRTRPCILEAAPAAPR